MSDLPTPDALPAHIHRPEDNNYGGAYAVDHGDMTWLVPPEVGPDDLRAIAADIERRAGKSASPAAKK